MDNDETIEVGRAPVNLRAVWLAQAREEIRTSDAGLKLNIASWAVFIAIGFAVCCGGINIAVMETGNVPGGLLTSGFGLMCIGAGAAALLVELRNQRRMRELERQCKDQREPTVALD